MVKDNIVETEWKYLDVNEQWQQMKKYIDENSTGYMCIVKSPCRHKETWWWNEEVAEAVREKKRKYGNWKKSTEAWKEYKKNRQIAKRVISSAKGKKQKECASDLNDPNHWMTKRTGSQVWLDQFTKGKGIQWSVDLIEELNCWKMLWKSWKQSSNTEFGSRLIQMICSLDLWKVKEPVMPFLS